SRMAHALLARGLAAGDRLCVYLSNSISYIDLFLAATRLGIIFVPVNILYRDREIRHILDDAEPVAIVSDEGNRAHIPDGARLWLIEDLAREAAVQPATRQVVVTDGDAPAALVYTSGTTGVSKGAIVTHNAFAVNALNLIACWQISSVDR